MCLGGFFSNENSTADHGLPAGTRGEEPDKLKRRTRTSQAYTGRGSMATPYPPEKWHNVNGNSNKLTKILNNIFRRFLLFKFCAQLRLESTSCRHDRWYSITNIRATTKLIASNASPWCFILHRKVPKVMTQDVCVEDNCHTVINWLPAASIHNVVRSWYSCCSCLVAIRGNTERA